MLPQFGPGVPRALRRASEQSDTAQIARAFLAYGVLRRDDWDGDLALTVQRGFTRWVNADCGCGQMRMLTNFSAFYSNDVEQLGASECGWAGQHGIPVGSDGTVGAFGLRMDDMDIPLAQVEFGCALVEKARAGAGIALFAQLRGLLDATIGVADADWAVNVCEELNYWHDDYDGDESDHDDRLTAKAFMEAVPERVLSARWEPKCRRLLHEAAQRAPELVNRVEPRRACALSLELEALVARIEPGTRRPGIGPQFIWNEVGQYAYYNSPPPAVCLRWGEDDPTTRVLDDYGHMLSQNEYCEAFNLHPFYLPEDGRQTHESIHVALHRFECVLKVLALCDRILDALNHTGPTPDDLRALFRRPKRAPRKRGKKLIQVLGDGEAPFVSQL